NQEAIHGANVAVVTGGQLMQRRVFDGEIAVAHSAADAGDGMTGHAAQTILRFGRFNLLADGAVKASVKKHGMIVASGAPLAGTRASDVLHVLNRFSIKLVVERSEVVHGALPLLVGILVT